MSESEADVEDYTKLSNKDLSDLKALTEQTIAYYTAILKADLPPGNRLAFELSKQQNEEELSAILAEQVRRLPRPSGEKK